MKLHIVGGDLLIERMFTETNGKFSSVEEADVVVFTGGPDVHPSYYKDSRHPTTNTSEFRDKGDLRFYWMVRTLKKHPLCVGICRGGQFLNVMHGGRLWQDVDGHALRGTHECKYLDPSLPDGFKKFDVTSTHHQMMRPAEGGKIWGIADRTTFRDTGSDRKKATNPAEGPDFEILYYSGTSVSPPALCFQPHPEYSSISCRELFFKCLDRALEAK